MSFSSSCADLCCQFLWNFCFSSSCAYLLGLHKTKKNRHSR
jgi:hypothetical protein